LREETVAQPFDETAKARILLVDDDRITLRLTSVLFERAGYEVWSAASAEHAFKILEERGLPHLAVIDIRMPEMDGLDLSRAIKEFCDIPIIMLTAVKTEETIVAAIEEFAEDYVNKPFRTAVLMARVGRVLARIGDFSYTLERLVRIDDRLVVELAGQRVYVNDEMVALTPTETKLLYILIRNAGRVVRKEYLLRRLWPTKEVFEDTLRVHLHRLRKKIEKDAKRPKYLVTVRGIGYRWPEPGSKIS
jgi:DNA-binding response OmpR family regulator